jgi:hypothetical protein
MIKTRGDVMRQAGEAKNVGRRAPLREDGTMVEGSPTMPARRLGRELKRLREAAGKTQVEAGKKVRRHSLDHHQQDREC